MNGIKVEHAPAKPELPSGCQALVLSATDLMTQHPKLHEPVIDGYLRRGETMNAIAPSKIGKTWMILLMAFAIARGGKWLGAQCIPGRVLIIDNELHPATLAGRIRKVADAIGDESPNIDVLSVRGQSWDMVQLATWFNEQEPGKWAFVVLDALYRFLPKGTNENDNGAMMGVYNTLDAIAKQTGAAIAVVHHSSKGNQSEKAQTDVGSGAGAISRAADTHLTIRHHAEEGYQVLEAVTRSFPSPAPKTVYFKYPLWYESDLEPAIQLKKSATEEKQQRTDTETKDKLLALLKAKRMTSSQLRGQTGFGASRVSRGLALLREAGEIEVKQGRKKGTKRKVEIFTLKGASG